MPFDNVLSSCVHNTSCYVTATPPDLVTKGFNEDLNNQDKESQVILVVDDTNDEDPKLEEEQQKLLILSKNFYKEHSSPEPVASSVYSSAFNSSKLFNPFQERIQSLSMSPFSPQLEEGEAHHNKSISFESAEYLNYRDDKQRNVICKEQEEKLFLPREEDSNDMFVNKPIYPWMVDSRHNTKNRQQPVYQNNKEQYNQYLERTSTSRITTI